MWQCLSFRALRNAASSSEERPGGKSRAFQAGDLALGRQKTSVPLSPPMWLSPPRQDGDDVDERSVFYSWL